MTTNDISLVVSLPAEIVVRLTEERIETGRRIDDIVREALSEYYYYRLGVLYGGDLSGENSSERRRNS